jgi:spore maturation protein CgeB
VGNPGDVHVGRHLHVAAKQLGFLAELADVSAAFGNGKLLRKLLWIWDRRPLHLDQFSRRVVKRCEAFQPSVVITTGVSPVDTQALTAIQHLGARVVNYSTDDPLNPIHRANWFLRDLPKYDAIYTPRLANCDDLRRTGCKAVYYLPFAYTPDQHFREAGAANDPADVVFVGGADSDRIPLVTPLINAGIRLALYGGFWDRYQTTRCAHRGFAGADDIRHITASAKVCLIVVRRANRDGHVMRSFEAAACGGCLLVEDTLEHREIFADTVTYFSSPQQMVDQAKALLADPARRHGSAEASYRRVVVEGKNTYADRLQTILDWKDGT